MPCRFLSTPSARRATVASNVSLTHTVVFLSTPSARRATAVHIGSELCHDISIHALREEGDPPPDFGLITIPIFLSTPSARRATTREIRRTKRQFYFYPRPPRGGRPSWQSSMQPSLYFYPRPPRGGRPAQLSPAQHPQHFYPRPPRGGRHSFQNPGVPPYEFLSTPSARRATQHSLATVIHIRISIHALREEGDALRTPTITTTSDFYPRPPRGGRPPATTPSPFPYAISIHALREEGDKAATSACKRLSNFYPRPPRGGRRRPGTDGSSRQNFYPRPPRGGRRSQANVLEGVKVFLSTPSARRATSFAGGTVYIHVFLSTPSARRATPPPPQSGYSIAQFLSTPSARRATPAADQHHAPPRYFYPRPPRGGRPEGCHIGSRPWVFLSTPSARRATVCAHGPVSFSPIFLSTPSARRATSTTSELPFLAWISIHALREEGDFQSLVLIRDELLFLSTPSARRATSPEPSTSYTEG